MRNLGEFTGPADVESISGFVGFVSSHATAVGYGEKRVKEIEAAVAEALFNIAEFVCKGEAQEITAICMDDKGRRFVIDIADSGRPFNMLLEADPFISGDELAQKGLTVKKMKKIGDVEYKRFEGKNHIVLTVYPEFKVASCGS